MSFVDVHKLHEVRIVLDFLIRTLKNDFTFVENNDSVNQVQEIDSMGYQNDCFILKMVQENVLEDLLLDIGIKSRDWIV